MSVFDGLPDIFADTFGESVIYTPLASGVPATITAIWLETPLDIALTGADGDAINTDLHVRATDVAAPAEGDTAQRVSNGKLCRVVPPIRPDGNGMIALALELV
jgi:hypothetical protein